ncbi:MCE family protein [Nocardia sp. CDC159]|uniref:MCE family protein n=1 Tax=Nocardia pulmonis TaxID=2951408 RepID=A0A9X2IWW9_9NOCA|nr:MULTISPECIES: MlaD family protein [Nocardia]MCM6774009.1 MCE family protein [Nocardia pulmonis]MCM6786896.1 MCE family protein [Nocardia sp. CDC159]
MRLPRRSLLWLALFAAAMSVGAAGLIRLLDRPVPDSTARYSAVFTDISGLYTGDDVRLAGVAVGKVASVELSGGQAVVGFTLRPDVPIRTGTVLAIRFQNLTGERYIAIQHGGETPGAPIPPGSRIDTAHTRPPIDLTAVFNGLAPIFDTISPTDVDRLTRGLAAYLEGDGAGLGPLLADIGSITQAVGSRDQLIGSLVANLQSVGETLQGRSAQVTTLLTRIKVLIDTLQSRLDAINHTLDVSPAAVGRIGALLAHLNDQWDTLAPETLAALVRLVGQGRVDDAESLLKTLPIGIDSVRTLLEQLRRITPTSCDSPDAATLIPQSITVGDRTVQPCR